VANGNKRINKISPRKKNEGNKFFILYPKTDKGNFNSPASPERRGGGQGAGRYNRLQAAKGMKDLLLSFLNVIVRLNAEYSSRPPNPLPPLRGRRGSGSYFQL
ncbi:MAG: hypothetical protein SOT07_09675, partial [Paludibacteraceae bacterium]|nr:hypothetical protein [Paludibacteraceae bacterium]